MEPHERVTYTTAAVGRYAAHMHSIELGRPVGEEHPPFIIAAIDCTGVVRIEEVLKAIDAAGDACCDAVKLTSLPWSWYPALFERASDRGLTILAHAEDERGVERLDWLGSEAFEVFFDWADLELVAAAARTGKPLVISVANATEAQISEVVSRARAEGATSIAIVQRVTTSIDALLERQRHGTVTGISSRTADPTIIEDAVAGGARIIEVRLRPRAAEMLATFVQTGASAWSALGNPPERWTTN